MFFHPLNEHRYFCKWGNFDASKAKLYGWNICLNYLFDSYLKGKEDSKNNKFDTVSEMLKMKLEMLKSIEEYNKMK